MKNSTFHRPTYVDAVKNSEKICISIEKIIIFHTKINVFQMKNQRFHESMYTDDDSKNVKKSLIFQSKFIFFHSKSQFPSFHVYR